MKLLMKKENLMLWKSEVMGMDFVSFGDSADGITNTYDRFVTHIQEVIRKLLTYKDVQYPNMQNEVKALHMIVFQNNIPENWWDIATQVGEGKNVENNPLKGMATKQDVYDAFLPAYRAIKENFDKRFKFFSWIFDHAKYTAERDSLKALSGLMQSVTGDSPAELETRYAEYKSRVQLKENADKVIKKDVDEKRKAVKKLKSKLKNLSAPKNSTSLIFSNFVFCAFSK